MSLSDLSSLASAASAVTVVISLLFLNRQIRLAEKSQRALIQQGRAGRTVDIAMCLMAPDFAGVYYKCMNGDGSISETQLGQFVGHCRAVFLGAEDSFLQHRESLLDEMAFVSFTASLRELLVSPGMRAMWQMTRDWYGPEFGTFMDQIVNEALNLPRIDHLTRWKAAVVTEISQRIAA